MSNDNHPKHLDDSNFESTVSSGVSLIDFYADWCGPCKRIAPIIESLSASYAGRATIAKVDVEKAPQVTTKFGVTSIPTLVLLKDGKEVNRVVGLRDEAGLKSIIDAAL